MDHTVIICRLAGFYLVIMSTVLMTRKPFLQKAVDNFYENPGFLLFGGVINTLIGLLIVLYYQLWTGVWGGLLLLLGSLSLAKGVLHLFVPKWGKTLAAKYASGKGYLYSGIVYFLLGTYFLYEGFYGLL